jgi:hypothetical protein
VDLPQPLGPMRATISCSATLRSNRSSATRRVPLISNERLSPRTSMASSVVTSQGPAPRGAMEGGDANRPHHGPADTHKELRTRRARMNGRLTPSLIRTVTVGSLQGIHRHQQVTGRGLAARSFDHATDHRFGNCTRPRRRDVLGFVRSMIAVGLTAAAPESLESAHLHISDF